MGYFFAMLHEGRSGETRATFFVAGEIPLVRGSAVAALLWKARFGGPSLFRGYVFRFRPSGLIRTLPSPRCWPRAVAGDLFEVRTMERWESILNFLSRHWQPLVVLTLVLVAFVVLPVSAVLAGADWQFIAQGPGVAFAFKVLIALVAPWFIRWQLRSLDRLIQRDFDFGKLYARWPDEVKGFYHSMRMLAFCLFYGLLFGL